ncbi:helix-turn-helix domain-containing protein [Streptomyces chryseus]
MTIHLRGDARTRLRDQLAQQYRAGASIRALQPQAHGRSYGFVRTLLQEAGVTLRPRSQHRTPK